MTTQKRNNSSTKTNDGQPVPPDESPADSGHVSKRPGRQETIIDISTADDVDIDEENTDEDEGAGSSQPGKGK